VINSVVASTQKQLLFNECFGYGNKPISIDQAQIIDHHQVTAIAQLGVILVNEFQTLEASLTMASFFPEHQIGSIQAAVTYVK